jgi:transcriptional regulator with XRE-family HTH domain
MAAKRDFERPPITDPERDYLARRLKEAREYLGLSQEYVSQQTKIPRPAISEAEAGRRRVESVELKRLAALYGRPLTYFLSVGEEAGSTPSGAGSSEEFGWDETEIKLRNLTKDLPADDKEEILRFAEYLRHKKQVSESRRSFEGR